MVTAKARHWSQVYDSTSPMQWRRSVIWDGVQYQPGDRVPSSVPPSRLRRLWRAKFIELFNFKARDISSGQAAKSSRTEGKNPAPATDPPKGYRVEKVGGPWYDLHTPDGETVRIKGLSKANAALRAACEG